MTSEPHRKPKKRKTKGSQKRTPRQRPLPPTPPEARLSDADYARLVEIAEHGRQALALHAQMQAQQNGHTESE